MFNILSHQGNANKMTSSSVRKISNTSTHAGEYVEQKQHFFTTGGSTSFHSHLGNLYDSFSENWESIYLKIQLHVPRKIPKGCSIILQGLFLNYVYINLFIIARKRKQPSYPLTGEWMKKMWYNYTMEYY